ncbi:ABC transporter permease [Deinococcus fonticola]|uniref:ABC transporter permease n=1 Tax=Deinococcus fonticola TaxID=2528713 RepID=UPI001075364C|nr:proline/glycine betaine ABC transporter permease [Deinococcus fonticola]
MFPEIPFPDLSIIDPVNNGVDWIVAHWGSFFRELSNGMRDHLLNPINRGLQWTPPYLFIVVVGLLAWHATRKWGMALGIMLGLFLIGSFGLWNKMLLTTTLMLVSTLVSVLIGIPTGIWMARSDRFRNFMLPVLDVMQTMPSFVYLIPVIMLFSLGQVPAVFATVIYALPPLIRLTDLGIRQVDGEVLEAARSFGTTDQQLLWKVQMPLARPSIMAGINQTIMMALAMVVLASMIGARGLGQDVLAGINTLDIGVGLQGGIAIVILAIVIDRITQGYGTPRRAKHKLNQPTATATKARASEDSPQQEVKA